MPSLSDAILSSNDFLYGDSSNEAELQMNSTESHALVIPTAIPSQQTSAANQNQIINIGVSIDQRQTGQELQ